MKTVGEILSKARWDKGLTVRQVAGQMGVSAMTISFAEKMNATRKMVSNDVIVKIAEFYGLDPDPIVAQYQKEQATIKAKNKAVRTARKAEG